MRRIIVVVAVAVIAAMSLPARAAVNTVVAGPGGFIAGYATPRLVVVKAAGDALFVNGDFASHDVVSRAKNGNVPKFQSDLINFGDSATIEGTSQLPPGDYLFYCTIHPDAMEGTLTVVA